MKSIEVVAAIIIKNAKILCLQRDSSKYEYISFKYEFPGGKIEANETREIALLREIKEELDLDIEITKFYLTVEHEYPDFKLIMHSYLCSCKEESLTLNAHIDFKWLDKNELLTLDWASADVPIVNQLISS